MNRPTTITVQIPMPLRSEVAGAPELAVQARTVRSALEQLEQHYPGLYRCVCDDAGAVRQHVNLFVNDAFLHEREGLDTVFELGDVLTIMPAVSGG